MCRGLHDGIRQRCLETIVVRKYIDAVVEQVKYIICLLGRELREGFSSREKEEKIIRGQGLFLLDKDKVQRLL